MHGASWAGDCRSQLYAERDVRCLQTWVLVEVVSLEGRHGWAWADLGPG